MRTAPGLALAALMIRHDIACGGYPAAVVEALTATADDLADLADAQEPGAVQAMAEHLRRQEAAARWDAYAAGLRVVPA